MKRGFLTLGFICILSLMTAQEAGLPNTLQTVINDMRLPHEARPRGVFHDWARGPRMGKGNDPGGFAAFHAWGHVYEAADGSGAQNVRVQIRNIRAYILSKTTGEWRLLQSSESVEGAHYREDYAGNVSKPAELRPEPSGGVSVTADKGYNFHFWTAGGRSSIDPEDVAGVFTTVQARLVLGDPAGPDERDLARYVLGMGGDYWLSLDAEWKEDWSTVGDAAIGRHKVVRPHWRSFNMTTLSADELRENPPPLGAD